MDRRDHGAEGGVQWNITLPAGLAKKLDLLFLNPVTKKPIFGKRSKLVTNLLIKWVEDIEKKLNLKPGESLTEHLTATKEEEESAA